MFLDDVNDKEDCSLWVPDRDARKMPIPFTTNGMRYSILYPDVDGHLNVKHGHGFKLSCTSGKFVSPVLKNGNEALVSCAGGDRLRYRGQAYKYADFRCDSVPKSLLRVTQDTCQPQNYSVVTVGFQTHQHYLILYRLCFDKSTQNSLYTWYDARVPYYDNHQKDSKRPQFIKSYELYGNTDVNKKYTLAQQVRAHDDVLK